MESTLLHSFLKAGNLKHWLAKLNCPTVIKECKSLFDKIYAPKVSEGNINGGDVGTGIDGVDKGIPADLRPLLGPLECRAVMHVRIQHNDVIYATSQTHVGWVEIYLRDENDNECYVVVSCLQAECVHYCIQTCQTQPNILHCLRAYHKCPPFFKATPSLRPQDLSSVF
jgi:hypothetical protein